MNIMLGNLTVAQIEERLGIEFPKDIREFMSGTHQAKANNIAKGKWHCYDIPFTLVCGDMATAQKIYDSVKHRGHECKRQLEFAVSNN